MVKFVLVTGGVLSGLGKGIISSSTGAILKSLGYRVTAIKIDPYINIDAGTMSPFEHGEVRILNLFIKFGGGFLRNVMMSKTKNFFSGFCFG